jgi:hypothetical protein
MIFLVHEEFADWMLDDAYKAAVGAAVQRLVSYQLRDDDFGEEWVIVKRRARG